MQIGGRDVDRALAWVESLTAVEDRDSALHAMTATLAVNGGVDALNRVLAGTSNRRTRSQYLRGAASLIIEGGAAAADRWIQGLNTQDQEDTIAQVIHDASHNDLPKMAHYAFTLSTQGGKKEAAAAYASRLIERSPKIATDWVLRLPVDLRKAGLGGLVSTWYDTDSEQLGEWLKTLPKGTDRDYLLKRIIDRTIGSDHENALALAAQITDDKLRKDTEEHVRINK